jgi:PAS domain S-box-containing protein
MVGPLSNSVEELLGQSGQFIIETLQNLRDGIFALDNMGNFVYLNKIAASHLEVTPQEIIGKNIWNCSPQLKNPKIVQKYNQIREKQRVTNFLWKNHSSELWYDVTVYPSSEGMIVHWRDVSEHKKAEEALKLAQFKLQNYAANLEGTVDERTRQLSLERERFFNMLEDLPVMVCLITADFKIPFANRMFRETFGEAKGRCCYEYVGCVNAPCENCQSLVPLKTGKPHNWTANFPNGTVVDAHDFPFTDVDGTKMILEADVDITERVNLQKKLQEKERLAAIGATAGMVGHDIRNPLQAITGDVYLLKDYLSAMPEVPVKRDVAESLEEIEKNVGYINKIVADLQDYAKQMNPTISEVNFYELVASVFRSIAIPEDVSPSIEVEQSLILRTDPTLLQRILTNLIINAMQAMPKGGQLKIGAKANNGQITVTVADTGVGIPDHIKPKLFTPMMTTKAKGQGLGLAVVKKSVEALGGFITFESQEGKGTKFTIELPL